MAFQQEFPFVIAGVVNGYHEVIAKCSFVESGSCGVDSTFQCRRRYRLGCRRRYWGSSRQGTFHNMDGFSSLVEYFTVDAMRRTHLDINGPLTNIDAPLARVFCIAMETHMNVVHLTWAKA